MRIFEDFIDDIDDSEKIVSDKEEQETPSVNDYQYVLLSIGNRDMYPMIQKRLSRIFNLTPEITKFCEYQPTKDSQTQFFFNSNFRSPKKCLSFIVAISKVIVKQFGGLDMNIVFQTPDTNYVLNSGLIVKKHQHQYTPGTQTNSLYHNLKDFIDCMTDCKKPEQVIDLLVSDFLDITNTLVYWVCSNKI